MHVRSAEPNAVPLIMTHGWPGSIVEFTEVIGPLTDPAAHGGDPADAFHLVVPSIPGYGFSGPTHEPGWNVQRIALAWDELMTRLGYERYGAQGGDWGASISRELGLSAPDAVIGVHLNMLIPQGPPDEPGPDRRGAGAPRPERQFRSTGMGYGAIQSTRPQTLAYALTDSPAGQLAWIAEKFYEWTDGDLPEDAVDRDQLLTNVTLYWLTGTAGSSARLYFESRAQRGVGPACPLDGTDRRGRVSLRDRAAGPALCRVVQQHRALERVRPRRPLRRHGGTRLACRRRPRVLSPAALRSPG